MFGNFAAQAGVIALNLLISPNIITPTLTWNFNNVIVFDFDPTGLENINDRPRINIWRDVNEVPDFNYLEFISGGRNVLSPLPSGSLIQPWGDRSIGTITFPTTSITNNEIIAGIDVFTHSFAPIKTSTLSPPIGEWTIDSTSVTGEIKYQYRFVVGQKNPQINVELDYSSQCAPVTIPACTSNQFLVYGGTGINGCPIFTCVDKFAISSFNVFSSPEVVTFINNTTGALNISNWRIVSHDGNQPPICPELPVSQTFIFPNGTILNSGQTVQVISDYPVASPPPIGPRQFLWTASAMWNNNGDVLSLYNSNNQLILTQRYGTCL